MKIEIKKISPSAPAVLGLFRLLDEHNISHVPPEICHLTQAKELENTSSVLLGVFCDGALAGMGGLKFRKGYAEVTRMFMKPEFRGKGLAVRLLNEMESIAAGRGLASQKLETSEKFAPACRLYLRYGFELCAPFGEYVDRAHNTYMTKPVAAGRAATPGGAA